VSSAEQIGTAVIFGQWPPLDRPVWRRGAVMQDVTDADAALGALGRYVAVTDGQ
jgi:hypothetical protein